MKQEYTSTHIQTINFGSNFDTTEFCNGKVTCRCESDTLDDTRAISYPKILPSEEVNAYGSPSMLSNH
jgi:hypothetical protein